MRSQHILQLDSSLFGRMEQHVSSGFTSRSNIRRNNALSGKSISSHRLVYGISHIRGGIERSISFNTVSGYSYGHRPSANWREERRRGPGGAPSEEAWVHSRDERVYAWSSPTVPGRFVPCIQSSGFCHILQRCGERSIEGGF